MTRTTKALRRNWPEDYVGETEAPGPELVELIVSRKKKTNRLARTASGSPKARAGGIARRRFESLY